VTIPKIEFAVVDLDKIVNFLLNPHHPQNGGRAYFFSRFGYTDTDWERMAESLIQHAAEGEVVRLERTPYGKKYTVLGDLLAPGKRLSDVISVWIIKPDSPYPRFVTAHPNN